jgi:hypothetical protein
MSEVRGLRVSTSAAAKEKRLTALLAGGDARQAPLVEAVEDAQLLGSLELAGFAFDWGQVQALRRSGEAPAAMACLRRAQHAVPHDAAFGLRSLLAWHAAVVGGASSLRTQDRARPDGPPPSPAAFVEMRLGLLEHWFRASGTGELKAPQQGALALARLVEILPFDEGNGRVARLAASHVMVRAGARPPILVGADAPRLDAALQQAFQLLTAPLSQLLEEASERCLDVMIQTLEGQRSQG